MPLKTDTIFKNVRTFKELSYFFPFAFRFTIEQEVIWLCRENKHLSASTA